jgi:hypothetical protein
MVPALAANCTPYGFVTPPVLNYEQTRCLYHKNIAYRPQDRVTGLRRESAPDAERLLAIPRTYFERLTQFVTQLLPPYAGRSRRDFASFRAIEERGRPARTRARNDLPTSTLSPLVRRMTAAFFAPSPTSTPRGTASGLPRTPLMFWRSASPGE